MEVVLPTPGFDVLGWVMLNGYQGGSVLMMMNNDDECAVQGKVTQSVNPLLVHAKAAGVSRMMRMMRLMARMIMLTVMAGGDCKG